MRITPHAQAANAASPLTSTRGVTPAESSPPAQSAPASRGVAELPGGRVRAFATIDMGSSSAKILVQTVGPDGRLRTVVDRKIGTALGKGVGVGDVLPEASQERALGVLRTLLTDAAAQGLPAAEVSLIATAAVRNARNGEAFMARVRDDLGLTKARVLSGDEEAELGYLGAIAAARTGRAQRFATIDLGGGSFQLAVGSESRMERGGSTQIGSNYVMDHLLPARILAADDFTRADAHLAAHAPMPLSPELLTDRRLVAVGGVSKFLRAHFGRDTITQEQVDALRREVGALAPEQRGPFVQAGKQAHQLDALGIATDAQARDYAAKLPASATLLLHIMRALGAERLTVSSTDARHAVNVASCAVTDTQPQGRLSCRATTGQRNHRG